MFLRIRGVSCASSGVGPAGHWATSGISLALYFPLSWLHPKAACPHMVAAPDSHPSNTTRRMHVFLNHPRESFCVDPQWLLLAKLKLRGYFLASLWLWRCSPLIGQAWSVWSFLQTPRKDQLNLNHRVWEARRGVTKENWDLVAKWMERTMDDG